MSRVSRCPACGQIADDAKVAFRAARGAETDTIVQCRNCTHGFLQPLPSDEAIANFYCSDYHCFRTSPTECGTLAVIVIAGTLPSGLLPRLQR